MSLINCPECNAEISNKATTCIKCGAPISTENIATKSNLVTTQATSKNLKMQSLIFGLALVIGLVMIFSATETSSAAFGGLLTFAGLIGLIVTRVRKWWHHD